METEDIFKELINKQLEPFGKTYDDVVKDEDWLKKYFWENEEKYNEYKAWAIDFIRKKLRWPKWLVTKEFLWFDMAYGLSVKK